MSDAGPFEDVDADPDSAGVHDPAGPGDMPPGPEPEPEPDKPFNIYGLRNTTADADPQEIADELDPDAGPRAHVTLGVCKQVGADGPEAWMHYALALYLFVDPEGTLLNPSDSPDTADSDAETPRGERWDDIE